MTNYLNNNEVMELWDEAVKLRDEETSKVVEEDNKKDIYYKIENCKVCKIKIKLPCTYDGNYPLCYEHRKPNDRIKYKKK